MQRKKPDPTPRKKHARSGWKRATTDAPEALDMAIGDEVVGTLGPVKNSKQFEGRRYRILRTADGARYFVNSTAALEQSGLFEFPDGQTVLIVRTKDVPIKGQANPMKGYEVYTPEGNGEAEEE